MHGLLSSGLPLAASLEEGDGAGAFDVVRGASSLGIGSPGDLGQGGRQTVGWTADPQTRSIRGMRLMALDGFVVDIPDMPTNDKAFGRPPGSRAVRRLSPGTHRGAVRSRYACDVALANQTHWRSRADHGRRTAAFLGAGDAAAVGLQLPQLRSRRPCDWPERPPASAGAKGPGFPADSASGRRIVLGQSLSQCDGSPTRPSGHLAACDRLYLRRPQPSRPRSGSTA